MNWERTFAFSTSVEKLFDGFLDPDCEHRMIDPKNAYLSNGAVRIDITENVRNETLAWTETERDNVWTMTATFESTETGCRMTLVRSGFGESDEWLAGGVARLLGWEQVCADIEVLFRTGVRPPRFYSNAWLTCGIHVVPDGGGIRPVKVFENSLADRAGVEPGDIVISVGGFPVFGMSDFWMVERFVRAHDGDVSFEYIRNGAIHTSSATKEAVPA
ncbi:MAG: PDZ domain-containing protein [Actinomycetota bacterium]